MHTPPSPAAYVGHQFSQKAAIVVNCETVKKYKDYSCRVLVVKKEHACYRYGVHWNGKNWVIEKFEIGYCPNSTIRSRSGGLFRLKA